ncbi:hypothetical protein OOU_Y34scaffold00283g81 [Pyricularia oryzae Y34]|uniref:Uncharacterized protein n=2 Tax=Pyricularia oryzae TaxID=318829 RepID=A0AA97PNS0_PYRO3|nr:hypothetical protein OOU_Y34scaffold00283g81 [Pyricularia oryzae Y34]
MFMASGTRPTSDQGGLSSIQASQGGCR